MKMSVAERIKQARGADSQEEFSEKIGIHKTTLGRIERGERVPDQVLLARILEVRPELSPAWLLIGEEPAERTKEILNRSIDYLLLQNIVVAIEEILVSLNESLSPIKKAQLITTLYKIFSEREEKEIDKEVVANLIRLAS